MAYKKRCVKNISIHALVKRATLSSGVKSLQSTSISIHALVKRATYRLYPQEEQQGYFNPRPREEGDRQYLVQLA